MRRRLVLVAAALALVGGTSALILARRAPTDERTMTAAAARKATLAGVIRTAGGRTFELGVEHRYTLELAHTSRSQAGDLFAIAVEGEWAIAAISTDDERGTTTLRAELRSARAKINNTDAPHARLGVPYAFTLAADGRLVALQLPKDVDAETRAVLTAITATTQLVDGGRELAWKAIETDSLGPYDAHYARDGVTLHKTKAAYRPRPGAEPLAIEIVDGTTTVALRPDGWPDDLDHHEHLNVGIDKLAISVEGRLRLHHSAVTRTDPAALPSNLETVAVDATSTANTDASDRELLDGASFTDLLAELARVRDDGNATGYQYLRLVALFRLDADAARTAGRAVLDNKLDPRDASAVIGALGEASTRDSQAALSRVVETRTVAHDARVHGALALGLAATPTAETLATLASASRTDDADLSATATLALGNAALRLRGQDASAATAQIDDLLARLRAAPDDDARVTLLRALGNTADARILPALEAALSSQRELVRAAAVEALRLIPDARADALVIAALGDRSTIVRTSAVFAASHRALPPLLGALAVTARRDPDATVRRAVIDLAGSRTSELPELRAIVENAASHDPDPDVRTAAATMLAAT